MGGQNFSLSSRHAVDRNRRKKTGGYGPKAAEIRGRCFEFCTRAKVTFGLKKLLFFIPFD
jgi:hypothetical protein